MQQFIQLQEQAGMALEQVAELKGKMSEFVQYSFFMLPFVFFLTLIFLTVLNLIIAKRFFRMHFKFLYQVELSQFQIPFGLVWFVIAFVVVLLVNEQWVHNDPLFYMVFKHHSFIGSGLFFTRPCRLCSLYGPTQSVWFLGDWDFIL